MRAKLATVTTERDRLRDQVDTAAIVIASLHAEDIAVREQFHRDGVIVDIGRPRAGTLTSTVQQ